MLGCSDACRARTVRSISCCRSHCGHPRKNQLPPHLRSTEMQRKEHCACLLQNQAALLVSCGQVQQIIHQQRQLDRRATQQLAHGPSTTQLLRGILGPRPGLVHRLVTKCFQSAGCQQDGLCPSNMVAHRLAQILPTIDYHPYFQRCEGARALLHTMLVVRPG